MTLKQNVQKLFALVIFSALMVTGMNAFAVSILPDADETVSIEVHKSRLIRLPHAANSVFIANPGIADVQVKSPRLIYLFGKKVGQTTLYAVDSQDQVVANLTVDIRFNVTSLNAAAQEMMPGADVKFASADGALVINGVLDSPRQALEIRKMAHRYVTQNYTADAKGAEVNLDDLVINRLRVDSPNQVNLRVRVAEVSRDVNKRLGFDWSVTGSANAGSIAFGLLASNPLAQGVNALSATVDNFSVVLDALEDEGLVTILSEPNLTAMSGEAATFLAGGEFPIIYPDGDGGNVIEFKKFGVSLGFRPLILDNGRIQLNVEPEVSQLSQTNAVTLGGYVIPSLTTRRANTSVELASGQSFAIAGLLQHETGHNLNKLPGLGNLPVLGALFRSDSFQREETELVIIVTPYLVKPIQYAKAALPTDGFVAPHDLDRLMFGSTYQEATSPGEGLTVDHKGRQLMGPVGFELN